MKKFMKILGITGIVFCLCGFAMAGVGYAFGGGNYVRAENLTDIKNIFFPGAGKIFGDGAGSDIKADTGNGRAGNPMEGEGKEAVSVDSDNIKTWKEDDIRLNSVSSITANLDYIDLKIVASDNNDFMMSYELHCMNRKNPLSYHLEDGALKLTETDFKAPSWKGWFWDTESFTNKYYSCITLYVPLDTVLKSCVLNMADSDLTIKELHCNTLEIEAAEGDMNIGGSSYAKAVLKAADGDIVFSGTSVSGDLLLDTEDGDISASDLEVSGDLQLDTADGDISVSDVEVRGDIQLDTADGDVSFSGINISKGMKMNAEDGDIMISSLAASGAVEIILCDGDISVSDFTESGGAYFQTEYGDVSASSLTVTGKLQIDTEDGDISLSELGVSGMADINSEYGDISIQMQKKFLSNLKITMETEDGELSAARLLGGDKRKGYFEKEGSADCYLKGYTEEGDISIQ